MFQFEGPGPDFTKAKLITSFLSQDVKIVCDNQTLGEDILWVVTQNRSGLFAIDPTEGKYEYLANGTLLIKALTLADEEFYACGYVDGYYHVVSTFSLFIKGSEMLTYESLISKL